MPSMTRRPSPAALAAARVSFGGMGQGGPEGEVAVGPRPNLRRGEGAVAVARATEGAGGGVGGVAPFVLLLFFGFFFIHAIIILRVWRNTITIWVF